jgi:hypothetical protein
VSDDEIRQFLEDYGCPPHIVRGGRQGLIHRWEKFVQDNESGYRLGLEDYRNDLDLREIIEQAGLSAVVHDADRRFRALLKPVSRPVWESATPDAFWIWGYPANASGALLEDLQAEGLA